MPSVLALISKAIFEKLAKNAQRGDVIGPLCIPHLEQAIKKKSKYKPVLEDALKRLRSPT